MKKLLKAFALLSAMSLIGWGSVFTSCSSDSDDDNPSGNGTPAVQEQSSPSKPEPVSPGKDNPNENEKTDDDPTNPSEGPSNPSEPQVVEVTGVTLDKTELTVKIGESDTLIATVSPEDASTKTVKWSSSDETIATVDENGKVTAVKEGEVTITVTTDSGEKTATCKVTVPEPTISYSYETELSLTSAVVWSGIPARSGSANVASLVTRAEGSYDGYLGKKFWVVDGTFAEFAGASGLGYTDTANDANRPAVQTFVKGVESEALKGPFKLTVTTNQKAERLFQVYVSADKNSLWTSEPVLSEELQANDGVHVYQYKGEDTVYVGFGTLADSTNKVYTSVSSIKLESNVEIPKDTFPATAIAFTNTGIENGLLNLTKDDSGFQLSVEVKPNWATNKTFKFEATENDFVKVSEEGVVTIDSSIESNEEVTVTVISEDNDSVKAELKVFVKAEVAASDKVEATVNAITDALSASAFVYGDTDSVVDNAKSLISGLSLKYKDAVTITPAVDKTTGLLTVTISCGEASDKVEYAYTETFAKAAVKAAVESVKEALKSVAWGNSADATLTAVKAALPSNLVDAKVEAKTGATEDGVAIVTVTVSNTVTGSAETAISVTENALVLEAPRFKVNEGVLYLTAPKYEYQFDYASLEATTGDNAWSTLKDGVKTAERAGKTKFTTKFDGTVTKTNKGTAVGTVSLKVSHVAYADIYVYNSNTARDVSFKLNSTSEEVGVGKDTEVSGNVIANTDGEVVYRMVMADPDSINTIVIQGEGKDVYPLGIVLYAPTGERTGITGSIEVPTGDIVLDQASDSYNFTVSGDMVSDTAVITWFVDDVAQNEHASTFTLSDKTVGETYEVRVDVKVGNVTYSKSTTVFYQ